ncbi:MAG: sulfotransferase family 2 domain-containing protein [Aquaticitalea sp.]
MIKKIAKRIQSLIKEEKHSPLQKGKNGNFIFIHIIKTGGTSIGKAIGLPKKMHLHVKEVISIIGEKKFEKAFVFCVVRNPWDQVVSHYKYRVKTNQNNMGDHHISFRDWVKVTYGDNKNPFYYNNPWVFASQSDWLKDSNGIIRVKNILKFESLNDDFEIISKKLGISEKLPHINTTKIEPYTKYYDEETLEIVRKWFKEDIELFNYQFDKIGFDTV